MNDLNNQRWAWVLTGSGHFFNESIDLINSLKNLDLFVSKAADEVLSMYKKKGKLSTHLKIYKDSSNAWRKYEPLLNGAFDKLEGFITN